MLTLKTKNARFEWVDDDVESVVTLSSEDDEATLVRKLKRIVALVEGGQAQPTIKGWTGPVQGPEVSGGDVLPTNGWAASYGPPALPERLQGEVELIQPGEDA
jgi:hypothetical protein